MRQNFSPLGSEKPKPPFPEALKERRIIDDSELFETFSKCAVNIPLLKLIKGDSHVCQISEGALHCEEKSEEEC